MTTPEDIHPDAEYDAQRAAFAVGFLFALVAGSIAHYLLTAL
ncbi:membrane protein [Microbacterium phage Barnstormer]|uniref:Membrane protein n=1 Tax=Microbacterium phage Barnstormer TaxID=3028491 RepID=A0AAE9ZR79_9CAUD|nr:membrane protein [Microbacterium phage Barnstormer]